MSIFKTGLLVLVSPVSRLTPHLQELIEKASVYVKTTLYIHLAPELQHHTSNQFVHVPLTKYVTQAVHQVYAIGASIKGTPDIRILLSNIGGDEILCSSLQHKLHNPYEVVLFERQCDKLKHYVARNFPQVALNVELQTLNLDEKTSDNISDICDKDILKNYDYVVLGGTFDKLHTGHSILLSEACMLANKGLTIGVTDGPMTKKKSLCELICPVEERILNVTEYLEDCKPGLQYNIVPIVDPYGPSIVEPELQCIVVSQETLRGGQMVNEKRQEKGLSILDVDVIDLVEDVHRSSDEEEKVSSSSRRRRLLGTLLQTPNNENLRKTPYVIGLTGGIASGKSSLCKWLELLGAIIIDCDKLGHGAYAKGTSTLEEIVLSFGADVLTEDGEINRKVLGAKVFSDKSQLEKLNKIVWPAISNLAQEKIDAAADNGCPVVVLDAAVLLEAGWDRMVHEIWVSIIPKEEAVKRIMNRNKLSEEDALLRINSQLTNGQRVSKANVVLSTLWKPEVTQRQVEKAWLHLQERICGIKCNI